MLTGSVVVRRGTRRRIDRLLRKKLRTKSTGLIVAGRFAISWAFVRPKNDPVVSVVLNGRPVATLDTLKPGPVWLDVHPRAKLSIQILGLHGPGSKLLLSERLDEGDQLLIHVQPTRKSFWRVVPPLVESRRIANAGLLGNRAAGSVDGARP